MFPTAISSSSLPPAVSHSGDSTDVSRGAGPLSLGERETWSRCQHFGNSPAPERDPPARGVGDTGTRGQGERRGLILTGLSGFVTIRCRACRRPRINLHQALPEEPAKGARGGSGGFLLKPAPARLRLIIPAGWCVNGESAASNLPPRPCRARHGEESREGLLKSVGSARGVPGDGG